MITELLKKFTVMFDYFYRPITFLTVIHSLLLMGSYKNICCLKNDSIIKALVNSTVS